MAAWCTGEALQCLLLLPPPPRRLNPSEGSPGLTPERLQVSPDKIPQRGVFGGRNVVSLSLWEMAGEFPRGSSQGITIANLESNTNELPTPPSPISKHPLPLLQPRSSKTTSSWCLLHHCFLPKLPSGTGGEDLVKEQGLTS